MKRPAFWVLLGVISLAAAAAAYSYFPRAFSIVALDITMNRDAALSEARAIMTRHGLGPADFSQAASFTLDGDAQTFIELEGGGKETFIAMLRDRLYSAYTWRVRHFKEGETNETLIRFTPDGKPYGFVERLKEDAPGATLDAAAARRRAEADAASKWAIDLAPFGLVEQGQERRPGGRIDHTLTYERATPLLNEGRYRLRLVLSGDRLTEVTYFIQIPEAFTRRYSSTRSNNEAIGVVSVVGMVLLYVVGGIGIGLFYMLRQRYVLWRQAALWGAIVGILQALAAINQWPLLWMAYDTAVPRSTFFAQQIASVLALAIGFSTFMALSFMAAETLGRKAFGHHPQFWRVWQKEPGSSTAVLGHTVSAYLLVAVFFAYDVILYAVATRMFGWWTPAEALIHPDVLATYVPWLSAIANSLQAGFWEEALFRAVPLAGAALIGDRFGKRNLFLVIAFIVQAIIFGAGHAPYPTQPSYARPVELILPSIGFGLLYIYYGLLPGVILHFVFDVVWFSLPIFLADAPGIWLQKVMVVAMAAVPLLVVVWRRVQVGRWTQLAPSALNAAWAPPPPPKPEIEEHAVVAHGIGARTKAIWLGVGAISLGVCLFAAFSRSDTGRLSIGRTEAAEIARRAIADRGVTLGPQWQVMAVPDDGSGGAHEFVAETAGNARRRELLGRFLPVPRWNVRIATFEGDVAERAEEWRVFVTSSGEVFRVHHTLPQGRAGASLDENAARARALEMIAKEFGLDAGKGQVREISARPSKLTARTDWTFTFVDASVPPLPQGELRIEVVLAGDEVARTGRFVHVPEEWERHQRAAGTRNLVLTIVVGVIFGGLLVSAAVGGVIAWSRRQYTPRLFFAAAGIMLIVTLVGALNGYPIIVQQLPTEMPLGLSLAMAVGLGIVALTITSSLVGLALGAQPHRLVSSSSLSNRDALPLGIAVGLFGAALSAVVATLTVPDWARGVAVAPMGNVVPILEVALDPVSTFLTRCAILLSFFTGIDMSTHGWTRRRWFGAAAVLVVGFAAVGPPPGSDIGRWIGAGLATGLGLLVTYVTLLRADPTMIPLAVGAMMTVGALARGAQQQFPGALAGSIGAAIVIALLAWWWFRALRRWRARLTSEPAYN